MSALKLRPGGKHHARPQGALTTPDLIQELSCHTVELAFVTDDDGKQYVSIQLDGERYGNWAPVAE